jgi:ATP-binding cassette subfamily B protein/subfamily B ATP-binding cassette protein MsbA
MKDIVVNNLYYYTTELIAVYGASTTLLLIGAFLVVATLLKTSCYFASVAIMVPMRTGIVRDIRSSVYHKIVSLPLSFFSE